MKFSLSLPIGVITPGEFQTMPAIAEMARALEAAKIDACFITDHPAPMADWLHAHGHDALDPFTALAFVAAASTRLRLHTNIVVLPYRNPFITAKAAATLQVLSGGRLILGVGGGYQKGEFDAVGVDFRKRGALFDEALETMRLAWAGGPVVRKGMNFDAVGNEPRPVPETPPTVWIGGGSDKAVERAAHWGDGWSPFFAGPTLSQINRDTGIQSVAHLGEKIRKLQDLRAAAGKTGAFDIAMGPQVRAQPSERQRLIDAIGELAEIGVNWATMGVGHASRAAYIEGVQWLGEEIVGRV